MIASVPADARCALLALYSEDMYQDPTVLEPVADPRLTADGWIIRGYLTAQDALFRKRATMALAEQRVFYGFLAESAAAPGDFVVVVRGTNGLIEWIEDAEYVLMPHPLAGRVECGFWGIYQSMQYRTLAGTEAPLMQGLMSAMGDDPRVTVIGHSLGGALATYLALDLARPHIGGQVSARLFASPRPGDEPFVRYVESQIEDVKGYAYEFDIVPRVPFSFGYARLPSTVDIAPGTSGVRIKVNPLCSHHALSYCAMLDPAAIDLAALPGRDLQYAACISTQNS